MSERPGFRPDIEGLRAVAILLVVAYHAAVPGFSGGFIGVDVFFVVSGYLITGLLVREMEDTGGLDLRRFYARRARRLLPAAALVVLVTLGAGRLFLSPIELRNLSESALATSVYASNILFTRLATDYLAADSHDNPLLHTWSLAVEEQFYLFWPLLLLGAFVLARRRRIPVAVPLAVVTVVSFIACTIVTFRIQPWAFFGSPFRAWEFGVGGLAALLPVRRLPHGRAALAAALLGLAALVVCTVRYDASTSFPGFAAVVPVIGTTLVLLGCARQPRQGVGRLLGPRPLQRVGALSYSWYLWHWPVLVFAVDEGFTSSLPLRVLWAILALLLADATFRLVEDPVRHHRALARPARAATLAASLMLVSLGCAQLFRTRAGDATASPAQRALTEAYETLPENYRRGCHVEVLDVEGPLCAFGDVDATRTVVLFGDSHAAQWLPAIDAIARRRGWRVVPLTKSECPVPDVPTFSARLGRSYHECVRWRDLSLDRIRDLDPALLFVSSSHAYPAHDRRPFGIDLDDWRDGLRRSLVALTAGGAPVALLRDTPRPGFVVPLCLSRARYALMTRNRACIAPRLSAVDTVVAAVERGVAADLDHVTFVDLVDAICDADACPPLRDGVVVYKDSNHLSAAFSARLAGPLDAALEDATGFAVPSIRRAPEPSSDVDIPIPTVPSAGHPDSRWK